MRFPSDALGAVEGTTVYDPSGNNIGSIKRPMIEKISGRSTLSQCTQLSSESWA